MHKHAKHAQTCTSMRRLPQPVRALFLVRSTKCSGHSWHHLAPPRSSTHLREIRSSSASGSAVDGLWYPQASTCIHMHTHAYTCMYMHIHAYTCTHCNPLHVNARGCTWMHVDRIGRGPSVPFIALLCPSEFCSQRYAKVCKGMQNERELASPCKGMQRAAVH